MNAEAVMYSPQDKPQWKRQRLFGENLLGMVLGIVLMMVVAYAIYSGWDSWVRHGLGW